MPHLHSITSRPRANANTGIPKAQPRNLGESAPSEKTVIPSGSGTHFFTSFPHTAAIGGGISTPDNAPNAIPQELGRPSARQNTVLPHSGQK